MTSPPEVVRLLDAADFAARKHAAQRRKDAESTPYINHPIGEQWAGSTFSSCGGSGPVDEGDGAFLSLRKAALLHDTVEDTNTTFSEIEEHFGEEVKRIVEEVTDDKLLPKMERKRLQIEHAAHCSQAAKLVKLADKLYNLRDLNRCTPQGFDTVTTGLSWSLLYLVTYPEIQKKIQQEIDEVIGRERKPKLSDRAKISPSQFDPWFEIYEIQQNIKESTTKDTVLNGYYIPRDTCVFVNQWQVNHDPKLWDNPSSFNPERFLAADGSGINRVESEKVLLFGLGKRRCIGENIGRGEIFLFLTILLQKLEFDVGHRERLDTTPQYGLTMKPQKCEDFQIKLR
ncbi:hypothetical protein JRQ81_006751 [Phrynocephalus forsythii]|uniref:unspecific monooxygenase n=1 Tax=Phrynocephalus forsythii TaxID=171643 RepID=A0A9Q1AUG6_9SAUR|nr:hypothetical protein JRQ81_006751 [Phrynocephalus forsythii]